MAGEGIHCREKRRIHPRRLPARAGKVHHIGSELMEQEIRQAIDPTPQLQPEAKPDPTPAVTIYDFSRLLSENEPRKNKPNHR